MKQLSLPVILWSHSGNLAEHDCACPDDGFIPAAVSAGASAIWRIAPNLYRAPLPKEHELTFNPLGPAAVVVINKPARRLLDGFASPRRLNVPGEWIGIPTAEALQAVQQLATLGLLYPVGAAVQPCRSLPHTLTAWLHVTNACNLRCSYCYLDKTDEAMSAATGRIAVEAVFRSAQSHGFRAVKLKYAGGEATLNFLLVLKLHDLARQLADESGLDLHEVVLSNGIALTKSMIDALRDAGIRLMISLDGIGLTGGARTFANGRGSDALDAHAVDRALARGLAPHLSITVTARNADNLAEAVSFALDRDLPFNLNLYRENDCAASRADLVAGQSRLIQGMRTAFAVIEARLPERSLIGSLVDRSRFDQAHEYTCGAGHNYLVIDHNGHVARCQMEIGHPVGNVRGGDPLLDVRVVDDGFQNLPVDEKAGCRDCAWKYWCTGGCPLLTFKATGRSDVQSPYCDVYKALYGDVLRLEALRLLKWNSVRWS